MKKIVLLFLWLFLFVFSDTGYCGNGGTKKTDNGGNLAAEGTIAILNTPDLQNLTHKWVDAFTGLNPGFTIKAGQISGYSNTGLSSGTGLMLLSDDYYHNLKNKSAWNMVIGRDVIVPVINSKNPFLNELQQRGLTAEEFAMLFNNPDRRNWGIVAAKGEKIPVHLYISSDASVQTQIASFLNTDRVPTTGVTTGSDESVQTALQNDPYAIVFCNLVNILDVTGNNFVGNLQILPVDKNRNGRMDYFEKIYENPGNFLRGVWIGKYPQALCRNIYAVSNGKPENAAEIAFLQWVLTGGQQFLGPNGYSCLVSSERQSNLAGLQSGEIYIASSGGPSAFQVVSIAMIFLVIAGFILSMLFQYRKHKHEITGKIIYKSHPVFDETSVIVPRGLYYDKTHTWAFMEENGIVKIGIDDFMQHITGPLTRITMKNPGERILKGEIIMTLIQNGKQLNIYAPVSGIIHSQNKVLLNHTSVINASPYTDGWVYMIEPANWIRETQFLIMAEKYIEWLKSEFSRLKDFFAASASAGRMEYSQIVLQDGGALSDNILMNLGPEMWEDFQTNFMDTYK